MTQLANNVRSALNLEGKLRLIDMVNGYKKAMTPNIYYGEKTLVLDKELGSFYIDGNETTIKLDKPITKRGKIEVKASYKVRHHERDFLKDWRPSIYDIDDIILSPDNTQRFSLDGVSYKSGILKVDGWALDPKMTDYKYHFIFLYNKTRDCEMARTSVVNVQRADVKRAFPNYKCGVYSGFTAQFITKDDSYYNDEIQIISRFTNDPNGDSVERSDYWGSSFRYETSKGDKKIIPYEDYKEPIALEYKFDYANFRYFTFNNENDVVDNKTFEDSSSLDLTDRETTKITEIKLMGIRMLKRAVGHYEFQNVKIAVSFTPIGNIDSPHIENSVLSHVGEFNYNDNVFSLNHEIDFTLNVYSFNIFGWFRVNKLPDNKIYENTKIKVYLTDGNNKVEVSSTEDEKDFCIYRQGQTINFSIWGKQQNIDLKGYTYVLEVINPAFDSKVELEHIVFDLIYFQKGYSDLYDTIPQTIRECFNTLGVMIQIYHQNVFIPTNVTIGKMIEITTPENKDG